VRFVVVHSYRRKSLMHTACMIQTMCDSDSTRLTNRLSSISRRGGKGCWTSPRRLQPPGAAGFCLKRGDWPTWEGHTATRACRRAPAGIEQTHVASFPDLNVLSAITSRGIQSSKEHVQCSSHVHFIGVSFEFSRREISMGSGLSRQSLNYHSPRRRRRRPGRRVLTPDPSGHAVPRTVMRSSRT
jgi:hypothetical protein